MILDTLDKQLQKGKNEKVIGLMKVELGEKNHDKICQMKSKNVQLLNRL